MIEKQCSFCGKNIVVRPRQRFCDKSCAAKSTGFKKVLKTKKFCMRCNKELEKYQKKFCSHSCSASTGNLGVRKHGYSPGNCVSCGKTLKGTSGKKYCSRVCQATNEKKEFIQSWLEGSNSGSIASGASKRIKNYFIESYGEMCMECGWNKVHRKTGKVPLELHHVDGNSDNNKIENLILLCPNCHSLTDSYRALNVGNGRKNRYT